MDNQAILCVDDEAIILMSLKRELQTRFGDRFYYETALNAEEALATISSLIEDGINIILIISDWLMPGMKGDEFLEKVYSLHPDTNVIMITGHADKTALERVEQIPSVRGIVKKPWSSTELAHLVESVCPAG
ncbi:MAG: response regulator [Spirochaetales bacterium]|nr:response regulator [Spirochaetales bacterium]